MRKSYPQAPGATTNRCGLRVDSLPRREYSPRMTLSARNRLMGKVVELQFGGVMAHVVVRVGKNLIESVITKRSADEMKLKVGDTVSAVIKSTEVMLEKK
jgi:molybdopterin-binding protein